MDRKGTEAEVKDRLLKSSTGTGYLKGKFYSKERFMAVFRIILSSSKNSKKNLDFLCFVTFYDFLS